MNVRLIAGAAGLALLPAFALGAEPPAAAAGNQFVIGGGVGAISRYAGSREMTAAPIVLLDYSHASGFFASTMRGLGYGGQTGPVTYSAALGYRAERKEKDETGAFGSTGSEKLKGMGDIEGNATAVLTLGYRPLPMLELNVAGEIPLSQRQNGKNFHTGVTARLLDAAHDSVSLGLAAGFGDKDYAQTYYGVTAAQARTTKFAAYRPKAGLYEANAMLTWQHRFGEKWSVTSMLGATQLLRDAARSPLVERKTTPTGAIYVGYSY